MPHQILSQVSELLNYDGNSCIYLPYDYPQFMCDRAYSEQYVLAAFIIANPEKYKIIMPNYFISEDKELSQILNPIWSNKKLDLVEKHGGSFWIEIQ